MVVQCVSFLVNEEFSNLTWEMSVSQVIQVITVGGL